MTTELLEETKQEWQLKGNDRCDACGAQAYVGVTGVTGYIYFCGHHYKQNPDKLESFEFETIADRERLIENRLQGED